MERVLCRLGKRRRLRLTLSEGMRHSERRLPLRRRLPVGRKSVRLAKAAQDCRTPRRCRVHERPTANVGCRPPATGRFIGSLRLRRISQHAIRRYASIHRSRSWQRRSILRQFRLHADQRASRPYRSSPSSFWAPFLFTNPRSFPWMKWSMSPSMVAATLLVSTPVRWSFTIW